MEEITGAGKTAEASKIKFTHELCKLVFIDL